MKISVISVGTEFQVLLILLGLLLAFTMGQNAELHLEVRENKGVILCV